MKKCLFILLLLAETLSAQTAYNIFYLSIGSGHYKRIFDETPGAYHGLDNMPAAINSALRMAALLDTMGAKKGRVLTSSPGKYLTRRQMLESTKQLIQSVKLSKVKDPLIVFYYCGHGFSNGKSEAHYIPPGDYIKNPRTLNESDLDSTLAPLDVREMLDESKIHYIMLLDCCYEGEQHAPDRLSPAVVKALGLEQMDELMGDTYKLLVAMNRMVGPDPVVFSTKAGNTVPVVRYRFADGEQWVGPLCRRSHMVMNEKLAKEARVTVSDFTVMLLSSTLDDKTSTSQSGWVLDTQNFNYIKSK